MGFRCGILSDASTPYDLGFRVGGHVHIQDHPGYAIVGNATQLRWVSPYQLSTYVVDARPCGETSELSRQYLALRGAMLASQSGQLDQLIEIRPSHRPRQVPASYMGCPVVVADMSPVIRRAGWMGEHHVGTGGGCTIYLETEYLDGILTHRRWDMLEATFRHEKYESGTEIAMAKGEFTGARPEQLGGLAISMNGLAHVATIHAVDKSRGEPEYNALMNRQRKEIGLSPQ